MQVPASFLLLSATCRRAHNTEQESTLGAGLIHGELNAVYSRMQMRRRYEVWFVRCGLADGSGAWWFRHLLVQQPKPTAISATTKYFQVWATWFPKDEKPQTCILNFPVERLELSSRGEVPF